jgi:hypothetical protein
LIQDFNQLAVLQNVGGINLGIIAWTTAHFGIWSGNRSHPAGRLSPSSRSGYPDCQNYQCAAHVFGAF